MGKKQGKREKSKKSVVGVYLLNRARNLEK